MTYQDSLFLPSKTQILALDKGFKPCSKRSWSRDIKKLDSNSCFILGDQLHSSLVAHHLYSSHQHPQLSFSLLNGVPISKERHKEFHKLFGQSVTPSDFKNYLILLQEKDATVDAHRIQKLIEWVTFLNESLNHVYI